MKVYTCKVWDGNQQDTVLIGVFSTLAKALEAGHLYIVGESDGTAQLLDWDEASPKYIYWYQDEWGTPFTREVEEVTVDETWYN